MTEAQHAGDISITSTEAMASPVVPEGDIGRSTVQIDAAYDSRRRRIFDHRVEAQNESNTMISCLAGVNSDLLDTELVLAEVLRQGFSEDGGSLETIERHAELIDLLLRVSKQITQVTQLEQRSRKGNGDRSAANGNPSG